VFVSQFFLFKIPIQQKAKALARYHQAHQEHWGSHGYNSHAVPTSISLPRNRKASADILPLNPAPNAFADLKAKFKNLLKGKKSKKTEKPADATKTEEPATNGAAPTETAPVEPTPAAARKLIRMTLRCLSYADGHLFRSGSPCCRACR